MNRQAFAFVLAGLGCVSCIELGVQNPGQSSSASSGAGGMGGGGIGGVNDSGGAGGVIDSGGAGGTMNGGLVLPSPLCPNDPSLIACFPFDDDFADKSPIANVTTPVDVTLSPGIEGKAADIGPSGQIAIANSAVWGFAQFTTELWYKQRSYSPTRVGLFDSDGRFGVFVYGQGELRCTLGGNVGVEAGMPLDTWIHVACTFNGNLLRLYTNGVLVAEAPALPPDGNGMSTIGSNAPSGDSLDGLVDRVRVWNVVRSAVDICKAAGRTDC